jgi:isoleucyl-tRNA synthetase
MDFSKFEQEIINYWTEYNLTQRIIDSRAKSPKWEFLDGPPFVNGSPHYGHLLVSSIKDTMGRYWSQKGYQISYQIGFDCHGLPLEQEAEKTIGKVKPTDPMTKLAEFNNECRRIIGSCSEQWYQTLGRLGRQFDQTQTYHTSDFSYMGSLWWAFKKLWDQDLIYCSKKVMPYSPLCETPLSNFEAGSNYQTRTDISVYVGFKLANSDEKLLIWTTTPWSLFANQAICVNPDLVYCLIHITGTENKLWICSDRIENFTLDQDYTIIKSVKGSELVGLRYIPIFPLDSWTQYIVHGDGYVQNISGTGLVHLAPLFGEDDLRVMKTSSLVKLTGWEDSSIPCDLVDTQAKFTRGWEELDLKGRFLMDTSLDVVVYLKTMGHALRSEKIKHSYPYCWRTDHPLIYLATDAWFLRVQKLIPAILENNQKITWYPKNVGTERFANWIGDAPDWCLSRNRVWGTPIPVWISPTGNPICVGSVSELEKLTGRTFQDIHLDKIGSVEFEINGHQYTRTFGIFDCWFESGMAGLARFGFPECANKSYPVDFIAESIDQTRGWFYTLNVLSTGLNNQPAFKNVIVSGLILASDGKKMSKRLGNYTDPSELMNKYGVDVLRLCLIGSPAAHAEEFAFNPNELGEITRKLIPWANSIVMLNDSVQLFLGTGQELSTLREFIGTRSSNPLDCWIINKFNQWSQEIYTRMENLELDHVPQLIFNFIDQFTNGYIKLSRDRLKGQSSELDTLESLTTLYTIIEQFNIRLGPFVPHLAEYFNKELYKVGFKEGPYESVHLAKISIEKILQIPLDTQLLDGFCSLNNLFETVRNLRHQITRPVFYPVESLELYINSSTIKKFARLIEQELNIKHLRILSTDNLVRKYKASRPILGKVFKKDAPKYIELIESGNIDWDGCIPDYFLVDYVVTPKNNFIGTKFSYEYEQYIEHAVVYLSLESNSDLETEATINNIRRQVNALRKSMGLKIFDPVEIVFESNDYWSHVDPVLISGLIEKLCPNVKFVPELTEFNVINTFNGIEIKVQLIF